MKILYKILIFIILIIIVLLANIFIYFRTQDNNEKYVEYCSKKNEGHNDPINPNFDLNNEFIGIINEPNSCYCRMYTRLLPRLLVYKVKYNNKDLEFIRPSFNKYFVPTIVLEKADVFISYGIANNIDFEYLISESYKKDLYAFDCGIRSINKKNEYLFFESECIGTDDYILRNIGQISSGKIHKFGEKLKELKLENKKIYLKMNIAGAELRVMQDILKYHKNLIGINLVIKYNNSNEIIEVEKLLKEIENDFVLVSRYELPDKRYCNCKYKNKNLATTLSLMYINKEYVDKKYLPFKQSFNEISNNKNIYKLGNYITDFAVSPMLILSEKIKLLFGEF